MKWISKIAAILSIAIVLNTVPVEVLHANNSTEVTSADTLPSQNYAKDQHDYEMQEALESFSNEDSVGKSTLKAEPAIVGSIVRLITLVFKNVAKGTRVTVKATARNVVTEVSAHAIERAIERGISAIDMDNVLSEKSTGMFAVEKYYDVTYSNARIMLDRNNKVVIVIDNALNTIITTYKLDSTSTIQNRISEGRWVKGSFKFK